MCNDDPFFFRRITVFEVIYKSIQREQKRERELEIGKEFLSDKISIFKMATTYGDVVTHLINSQQGVNLILGDSNVSNINFTLISPMLKH